MEFGLACHCNGFLGEAQYLHKCHRQYSRSISGYTAWAVRCIVQINIVCSQGTIGEVGAKEARSYGLVIAGPREPCHRSPSGKYRSIARLLHSRAYKVNATHIQAAAQDAHHRDYRSCYKHQCIAHLVASKTTHDGCSIAEQTRIPYKFCLYACCNISSGVKQSLRRS